MKYQYWVKLDNDNQPMSFCRYSRVEHGIMEVWHDGKWRGTILSIAEVSGMGGDTDWRTITEKDALKALARHR
jgi:hypothetical protein